MENEKPKTAQLQAKVINPCDFITSNQDTLQNLTSNTHKQLQQCNLYLGGVAALTSEVISSRKIQAVLTIMTDKQKKKSKLQQKIEYLDDINRHNQLMCHQSTLLAPYFRSAIEFINDSFMYKMNVLVHCKEGDCKSAALVIAYIIYKFKISFEKAYEIIKAKRPSVKLTEELEQQLKQEQEKLHQIK